jgi:hypothetical protein
MERVFVCLHVDASAAERYSFHGEPKPLFEGSLARQLDLASGAHDAVPREQGRQLCPQQAGHGTVIERIAGGGGDLAVSGHLSFGDGENDAPEGSVALMICPSGVLQDSPF